MLQSDAIHVHVNPVQPMPSCLQHRFVVRNFLNMQPAPSCFLVYLSLNHLYICFDTFFQQLSSWHCIRDIYVLNVLISKMLILFILDRYAVKTEGMRPCCPYYSQTCHSLLLFLSASGFASHILLCNFIFHGEVIIQSYAEAVHESDSNFSSIHSS